MASILFFGGSTLLSLGFLGEYISRILVESKRWRYILLRKNTKSLYRNSKARLSIPVPIVRHVSPAFIFKQTRITYHSRYPILIQKEKFPHVRPFYSIPSHLQTPHIQFDTFRHDRNSTLTMFHELRKT